MNDIPKHVAIIMDGNGRWGQRHYGDRTRGHVKGVERVEEILVAADEYGIEIITLFAFSSENWNRPEYEVTTLMQLFQKFALQVVRQHNQHRARIRFIGDRTRLPKQLVHIMQQVEERTRYVNHRTLQIALSYGSRAEMVVAVRRLADKVRAGSLDPEAIDEAIISAHLYTADIDDPDLIIRTGGEQRLSNFLLWQAAYAELKFTSTLWPDFTKEEFFAILSEYSTRERRFGKVPA